MNTQTAMRLTIRLENEPGGPFPTIDYFPHRADLKDGYTHEDALIYLAMMTVKFGSPGRYTFNPRILEEIARDGIDGPCANLKQGAFVCAHEAQMGGDLQLERTSKGARVNNGYIIPQHVFSNGNFYDLSAQNTNVIDNGYTQDLLDENHDAIHLKLALLAAALPAPDLWSDTEKRIGIIGARMARLMDLGYGSGAEASKQASKDYKWFVFNLFQKWFIAPDHVCCPTAMVANKDLQKAIDNVPLNLRDFGAAVWGTARRAPAEDLSKASLAKKGQTVGASNHQTLQLQAYVREIDAAIEANAPLRLLKPAPRKRQEKSRA